MASGGSYTFWLGASADADVDPLRVWAVIERHSDHLKIGFVLELTRVLGLKLVVSEISQPNARGLAHV